VVGGSSPHIQNSGALSQEQNDWEREKKRANHRYVGAGAPELYRRTTASRRGGAPSTPMNSL